MDILYIINKTKSYCDNWELRWSLRSLEQYGKGIDRVFIAGELPEFLNEENVILVPFKQDVVKNSYEKRIQLDKTIKYVIDNYNISDDFIVSMDDHYLIKEVDFNNYPYYVRETKENGIYLCETEKECVGDYHSFVVNTCNLLKKHNLPIFNFIVHKNFKMNRHIYNECWDKFKEIENTGIETFALCLNYQYNKNPFGFVVTKDHKLYNKTYEELCNLDTDIFSSYDMVDYCTMFKSMMQLYPNKSKYEL